MQDNKKTWALSIIGVIALLLVVVGATYAYFKAQGGTIKTGDVNVLTYTTDSLVFQKGDNISLIVNQNNFSNTKGSLSMETYVKATLTANNKTNKATDNYYVYLDITENGIDYTTTDKKPELVLTVTDKDNNPVTITGLDEVTVTDRTGATITGYDITSKKELITILNNKEISVEETNTEHKTEQRYNIKITMVNLDKDQTANTGKNFVSQIIIKKDKTETTIEEDCQTSNSLACKVISNYTPESNNDLYFHDGEGTYSENEANDSSYRYIGSNPDNYVCFGSDAEKCPDDNLYRIIGVFDGKIKLIKNTYLGDIVWDNTSNTWSNSNVKKYLNENYYYSLDAKWQGYIEEVTWKVGGNTSQNIEETVGVKNIYTNEITNSGTEGDCPPTDGKTEDTFKVGLMYVSDYMYAADPTQKNAWSALQGWNKEDDTSKDFSAVKEYNWMAIGVDEWTITRDSSSVSGVYIARDIGNLYGVRIDNGIKYRPAFYLKTTVEYISGDGSKNSPFRLSRSDVAINSMSESNMTNNSFRVTLNVNEGDFGIKSYHYAIVNYNDECPTVGNANYKSTTNNYYDFTNLEKGIYNVCSYVIDNKDTVSNVVSEKFNTIELLAEYVKGLYTVDGENKLYYHDKTGTYGAYEAGDSSYRYTGFDPDNYVCFGTDANTCPEDNLYRIIGVFGDKVKLIKKTSIGFIQYSDYNDTYPMGNNNWNSSIVNKTLKETYLANLDTTWQNYITNTKWQIGGNTASDIISTTGANNVYASEIVSPAVNKLYDAKIGLMYVSDYMYGADPTKENVWSAVSAANYNSKIINENNWLFNEVREWTITHESNSDAGVYNMDDMGGIFSTNAFTAAETRPVLNLNSNVNLIGGNGKSISPYRIKL